MIKNESSNEIDRQAVLVHELDIPEGKQGFPQSKGGIRVKYSYWSVEAWPSEALRLK